MSLTSYRAAPPRGGGIFVGWIRGPGGDRLFRILRCSIIGAGAFHVRVRDGIGWKSPAIATRSSDPPDNCVSVWEVGVWYDDDFAWMIAMHVYALLESVV